jgi:regulatory protein
MEKSLKARAVDLLSRREYTRRELERRLAPFAESAEQLATLLDELAERNWQSDSRFAQQFADSRGQKYGSRRLQQEMRQRGVSQEDIACWMSVTTWHWPGGSGKKVWQRGQHAAGKGKTDALSGGTRLCMDIIRQVMAGSAEDDDFPAIRTTSSACGCYRA